MLKEGVSFSCLCEEDIYIFDTMNQTTQSLSFIFPVFVLCLDN